MSIAPARFIGHGCERIVAIHGWLGDHRLFEPLFDELDSSLVTCAFLDCRGYGARRHEPGPFTIEAIAADVLSLAASLGWDRFHVLGHSMGGLAVQRLMLDAPERLRSAILVAPVPACGARLDARRRDLLLRAIADPAARRDLIDANTGHRLDRRSIEGLLRLSLESADPAVLESYLKAWTEADFAAEMVGSTVPVQTICGELDPAIPVTLVRETIHVWRPDAALAVIASTGHYPMYEDPAALASVIGRHLDSP